MSTTITLDPNNNRSQILNQLGTYNYTVPSAGMYTITCNANVRAASGLIIALAQNSTAIATSPTPTSPSLTTTVTGAGTGPVTASYSSQIGQENINLSSTVTCAAGDVLSATLSSSVAHDSKLNDFKAILNIRPGTV
jgi:hypothetical protein